MKKFLRENPTIAFGLGLPLLLVVVFLLISGIPSLVVPSPQYDVIYATEYRNYQNNVHIAVVEQKVQVIYRGLQPATHSQKPRMWRYSPATSAVKEIAIILPPEPRAVVNQPGAPAPEPVVTELDIPELAELTIDSSSIAPDGYEFRSRSDRYSRNVFRGVFYSTSYHNEAVLIKNGRRIRLPNTQGHYYGGDALFLGWVVPQ